MHLIPLAEIIIAVDEELQFTRCGGDALDGFVCDLPDARAAVLPSRRPPKTEL